MFGIITATSILECLIFLPMSFTILQFFLPAHIAFLLSAGLVPVSILASWISRLKPISFVYKIISLVVSFLIAFIVAQVSGGTILIVIIYTFVFMRVKANIDTGRDITTQLAIVAIFFNIALALVNVNTVSVSEGYSNAAILISTIAAVISLILKQVDDSRRFGKNDMDIGTTQRKNNKIFAGVAVVLLLVVSSIGQVSSIYRLVINGIVKFFQFIANLLTPKDTGVQLPEQQVQAEMEKVVTSEPSLFAKIIEVILSILAILIIVALLGWTIYTITKKIIKLVKWIINWFKNGEQAVLRFYENGHIDERHSLYNRNFQNMAKRLRDIAAGIFDREIPYNKLPNGIAKLRRLFKQYKKDAQLSGIKISNASTAQEICQKVSDKSPETNQINILLSKCYNAARYDETAPSPEELLELEGRLLK